MAISEKELREARKAGFKLKMPKKPKKAASLRAFELYLQRVKDFERKVKEAAARYRKRESLIKKIFK